MAQASFYRRWYKDELYLLIVGKLIMKKWVWTKKREFRVKNLAIDEQRKQIKFLSVKRNLSLKL